MFHARKTFVTAVTVITLSLSTASLMAEKDPDVGGAAIYPSENIVQNAVNSKDHTPLVAARKAAGLVDTLQGPGPFPVFAPVNQAFDKLSGSSDPGGRRN
jgi:uncharacterized surface protein with fasciclin (FAS1) repeats